MSNLLTFDTKDIKINNETRYLEFFQASIGIGTQHWPCVKLVTHKKQDAEEQLLALNSGDIAADMQARQTAIFTERTKADVNISISVKGEADNKFKFDGLMIGPSYAFSAHNVELADQAIPLYTKINFLNLSIYKDVTDTGHNFDHPSLQKAGTICNMAKGQMTHWMENSQRIFADSDVKQYLEAQHKVNEKVKNHWEALLDASKDTFGWKDIKEYLKDNTDKGLRETLANIATQNAGTFSTVIDKFAEEFQCIYVPGWNNIGYFKSKKDLYANPKELIVTPINMTINTSNGFGLLPTAYIGIESTETKQDSSNNGAQYKTFVCVPKENIKTGQMIRMLGPKWLQTCKTVGSVKGEGRKRSINVSNVAADREETHTGSATLRENVIKGMEEYGLCAYAYLSLADSKAEITMPINFKLEIGNRYTVKNKDGATLFEGLLAHVTHVLSTKSRSPMAHTTATFTHIEIGEFKLAGVPRE